MPLYDLRVPFKRSRRDSNPADFRRFRHTLAMASAHEVPKIIADFLASRENERERAEYNNYLEIERWAENLQRNLGSTSPGFDVFVDPTLSADDEANLTFTTITAAAKYIYDNIRTTWGVVGVVTTQTTVSEPSGVLTLGTNVPTFLTVAAVSERLAENTLSSANWTDRTEYPFVDLNDCKFSGASGRLLLRGLRLNKSAPSSNVDYAAVGVAVYEKCHFQNVGTGRRLNTATSGLTIVKDCALRNVGATFTSGAGVLVVKDSNIDISANISETNTGAIYTFINCQFRGQSSGRTMTFALGASSGLFAMIDCTGRSGNISSWTITAADVIIKTTPHAATQGSITISNGWSRVLVEGIIETTNFGSAFTLGTAGSSDSSIVAVLNLACYTATLNGPAIGTIWARRGVTVNAAKCNLQVRCESVGSGTIALTLGASATECLILATGTYSGSGNRIPYSLNASSANNIIVFPGAGDFPNAGVDSGTDNLVITEAGATMLQGEPVGSTTPTTDQALIYDGDSWEPTDIEADMVGVTDSGGYFSGADVEAVLQEVGASIDGVLGYAIVTASQGSITSVTDLTDATVDVVVPAGAVIKISAYAECFSSVAGDNVTLRIVEDGTTVQQIEQNMDAANTQETFSGFVIRTPGPALVTYKLTLARSTGSGNVSTFADATHPVVIVVEQLTGRLPVGGPRGVLDYAERTSEQTAISSEVDLTDLTVTVTLVTGRLYKVTGNVRFYSPSAALTAFLLIDQGGTTIDAKSQNLVASGQATIQCIAMVTGSGSTTFKLRASTSSGTVTAGAGATFPNVLIVEDVGPA